jgi:glucose-1-phosphate adenylyltransferase
MGIYVFNADFLHQELLRDEANLHSSHDFGHDILPGVIAHGRVYAHDFSVSCVHTGAQPYWRDVGTLDAYWAANMDLLHPQPEINIHDDSWPVRSTHPRLLPEQRAVTHSDHGGVESNSMIASGCKLHGASVQRSVLFSDTHVGRGSSIEHSVLFPNVRIGRDVVVRRAIIDSHCILPDGIKIGLDPSDDKSRFTVSELGVTLVTPSMLGQRIQGELLTSCHHNEQTAIFGC